MNLRLRFVVVLVLCTVGIVAVAQTSSSSTAQTPQSPREQAWSVLKNGLTNSNMDKRKKAVAELGLLPGDSQALDAALTALKDDKPDVRVAAAQALGDMSAKIATPQLIAALQDTDVSVILTAAHTLVTFGNEKGYNVFYAVLTGQQKSGESLAEQQKKMLNDPKKLAGLGFQTGLGFVPFGSLGYSAFKLFTKDDVSPVLAAAALTLAKDPDPKSGQALVNAAQDQKKWLVRAAAYDAIAKRGDPSLKGAAVSGLQDAQEEVQYSAAAAVIRLSDIEEHPKGAAAPAKRKPAPLKK
jgi:HEAT repeat protein